MTTPPERSAARDAAIEAMLPLVPAHGWSRAALRRAAGPDAELLFPGGPGDMVETFIDWMDRRMAAETPLEGLGLTHRVRALIATRLAIAAPHRAAVRRAAALLALPPHALRAARCTGRTVEAIWEAAGDRSADFSWYTKRAILAGIYSATLFYWLAPGRSEEDTLAFLDRRLAAIGRIGKLRARLRPAA